METVGVGMGLVCIQNETLLVQSKKSQSLSSSCLPFQHSRGKNHSVDFIVLMPLTTPRLSPTLKHLDQVDSVSDYKMLYQFKN